MRNIWEKRGREVGARRDLDLGTLTELLDGGLDLLVLSSGFGRGGFVVLLHNSPLSTYDKRSTCKFTQEMRRGGKVPFPPSWAFPNLAAILALAYATSLSMLF